MLDKRMESEGNNKSFSPKSWLQSELAAQQSRQRRYVASVWIWRALVIGGFLLLWEYSATYKWVDPFFTSSPSAVARFLMEAGGTADFWENISITIQETLLGVAAAAVAGVLAAFLLAQSKMFQDVVDPILSFLNSLPRVAFAPLFVAFFGLGMLSKVVLAFSLCFFIVLEGTLTGMKRIDPDLVMLTKQLGAGRVDNYTKLVMPNALPSIFAALRLSLIYGFLAVVVGEMIGANKGLGQQIAFYSGVLRTDAVFGLLLVLGIIASLFTGLLRTIENHLLRWQ